MTANVLHQNIPSCCKISLNSLESIKGELRNSFLQHGVGVFNMSLKRPFDSISPLQPINRVNKKKDRLCPQCIQLDIQTFFSTSRPVSESDDSCERWGSFAERDFRDIKNSIHCPLCQLICKALPKAKHSRRPKSKDKIYFYRILYGEYERKYVRPNQANIPQWWLHRTNRLLVSTIPQVLDNVSREHARFLDCIERMVDKGDDSEGYIMFLGAEEKDKHNFLFQGRTMLPKFDFNLAKRWINICENSHGDTCSPHSPSEKIQRPLRLINITERRVEDASFEHIYATLSYRWPEKSSQLTLGVETTKRLTAVGGLADDQEDILLSIRDAMIVCSKLSIPYLWVDALCVMQDDEQEKKWQMSAMADIYKGTQLTIAAASVKAGLPGVRNLSRAIQQTVDCKKITLAVARLDFEDAMKSEPLGTRIWIFQEFIFSRRLLIFADAQVFFKCDGAEWCEDTGKEHPQNFGEMRNITLPFSNVISWKEFPRGKATFFNCFTKQLENYTKRQGSNENDILRAFDSFLRISKSLLNTGFFYGLPTKLFFWALLFDVSWGIPRKGNYPSWSWCSWKSSYSVEYDNEEVLETYISFSSFYRVIILPGSAPQLLLIQDEPDTGKTPSHLITLPTGLTDCELGYLLIFNAHKADVSLDREIDNQEEYPVRLKCVETSGNSNPKKQIGTVHIDMRFRQLINGDSLECVEVGLQYMPYPKGAELGVKLLLIQRESRGVSRRLGLFVAKLYDWLQASPKMKMIYII